MINSLHIKNFAIVKNIDVEWSPGMTTITGETGAGKSIGIDALALCLGERADASAVRGGEDKAEIIANFNIKDVQAARQWLKDNEMLDDDSNECIIRRVILQKGGSKAWINGSQVPLQQLKELGQHLIRIHGQHAHQLLTRGDHQRYLIDLYAQHQKLQDKVALKCKSWQALIKERNELIALRDSQEAHRQLLEYQVNELDEFALQPGEFESIEQEHNLLSNGQRLYDASYTHLERLYGGENGNAWSVINSAMQEITELADVDKALEPISSLLMDAAVQVEEASRELRSYVENLDLDPSRLQQVDERLSAAISLARKHQVKPEELAEHHSNLALQLTQFASNNSRIDELEHEIESARADYSTFASQLTESRRKAAKKVTRLIMSKMKLLNMEKGLFDIAVNAADYDTAKPSVNGNDDVSFLVSANPGQPLQPLGKVASGGELSRISLALQVTIGDKTTTPTMIFDEVDVGVSGPTASSVGTLLRELGDTTQVICVTHLPQVAAKGHNQMFVNKKNKGNQTETSIKALTTPERVDEIARLLGGDNITATARANASELLTTVDAAIA